VVASKLVTSPLCHGMPRPTMKRTAQNFDSTSGRYCTDRTRVKGRFRVKKQRVLLAHFSERLDRPKTLALRHENLRTVNQRRSCKDSWAAAIVRSISASVWAAETNRASNCDGARKIPRSNIPWKNFG